MDKHRIRRGEWQNMLYKLKELMASHEWENYKSDDDGKG